MASSSSAPPLEPRPYEVFLSFRGVNTRLNFLSHLRGALKRRGIITFYDDESLRIGQDLSTELVEAIQKSSIAIVVFSQDYASSTWCLKELVKIVECKNEGKLEIYPIFYHVEPTDVRKQQNSFLEAFSGHEVNFKDNVEMVNTWRKALTEVSNLKGVDFHEKYEALVIGEIADEILWKLPLEASPFTESLVGMESRISELKILINKNPDEARFIGFCGMGGVGKTTTVRAIFEECKSKFDGSCFLGDVRRKKNELEKLQQQLLSQVLKCPIDGIYDVYEGSSMIRKRMCGKRILLVVDDVDDIEQLDVLAGHRSWFGPGSRIIITTRNAHLLNNVDDRLEIGTLNDKEALHLFRNHAFKNNEHPEENYMKLSHQVLRYAGGLPLALKVLGNHLDGQEESFWLAALERLKEVPEGQIISQLQISYDGLNPPQKDIFLYIACCFRGEPRDEVLERLRAMHLHPGEGIRVLIQKSLIRHDYTSHGYPSFEMHDLLQDMGHHIVGQSANSDVRRYSHLWRDKDIKNVLLDYKGSAEAKGIVIDKNSYSDVMESKILKEESFKNMNKLKFLKINSHNSHHEYEYLKKKEESRLFIKMSIQNHGTRILPPSTSDKKDSRPMRRVPYGKLSPTHEAFMNTLKGLTRRSSMDSRPSHVELPRGLQCLYWGNYPGKCLETSFQPTELVHLEMPDSLIESTPDFDHMPNLEVLDLNDSDYLVHIHPSLGRHMKIRKINLSYCRQLKEFPEIIQMDSLQYLNLGATGLRSFPETSDFNQLPNLLNLNLSRCKQLSQVHASLGAHKKIVRINLKDCIKLKEFPTIVDMGCLQTLDLSGTKLQCFPEITGSVDNLEILDLSFTCITTLPRSIARATGLQEVNLGSCGHLVSLPISLQALEKVKIIQVAIKESDLRVKDFRALFAPKVSVEVVNARAFPLKGNVIRIFVATVGLVVVMVLLWFLLKLLKMMDAGV